MIVGNAGDGPAAAGLGFAAFSATVTAGRLAGDRLLTRFGRLPTVRAGCTCAALGTGLGLAGSAIIDPGPQAVAAAVAGYAMLGAGISVTFPALLAEAGHRVGHLGAGHSGTGSLGPALAAVSTGGYPGFLIGPTAIGGVAEVAGLDAALWILPALAVMAALLVHCTHGSGRTAGLKPPDQSALGNGHPTPGAQRSGRAARAGW